MSLITFHSCKNDNKEMKKDNPFFAEYQTPFQVPPFDKIDTTDYMPAFIEGIKRHDAEIEAIVNNTEAPDFDNTILVLDKSGLMLTHVRKVFFNLLSANTNDQFQAIAKKVNPMLSKHNDDIAMNAKLFKRVKAVYEKRNDSKLDSGQIRVVEKYFKDFERNGANLSKEDQDKLIKNISELKTVSLQNCPSCR